MTPTELADRLGRHFATIAADHNGQPVCTACEAAAMLREAEQLLLRSLISIERCDAEHGQTERHAKLRLETKAWLEGRTT